MSENRPPLRPCPRCRITMQAGRSDPSESDYDTFTCLNCDLVLSYARHAGVPAGSSRPPGSKRNRDLP